VEEVSQLGSFDEFFYHGKNGLDHEIEAELLQMLIQPQRTLFYNRLDSCGVNEYENAPNDLSLQVELRYNIARIVAWKNRQVSDGSNGTPDRRIAVSQNSISFEARGGELDIKVLYIPYYDYQKYQDIRIPLT